MAGFNPLSEMQGGVYSPAGTSYYQWGGRVAQFGAPGVGGLPSSARILTQNQVSQIVTESGNGVQFSPGKWGMFGRGLRTILQPGMLLRDLYLGQKGELSGRGGFWGMADAVSINLAGAATYHRFAQSVSQVASEAGNTLTFTRSRGWMAGTAIGLGAYTGAQIGNSMLGIPGSFIGAGVGGLMGANWKLGLAGAAIAGGGYLIGKGATSLLKTGYQRKQNNRRIDTAGSTAAFMTMNAVTMRERAVMAIQKSHLNARSALGQEAAYLSYNRDYFSPYR